MPEIPTSTARVVVAIPPSWFFGGNDRHNAEELLKSIRAIYANVFVFDVGIYYSGDNDAIDAHIAEAKAFKPDVAIGLPNATYVMMLDEEPRRRKRNPEPKRLERMRRYLRGATPDNVLADVLKVPTVLMWDHIITQPAHLVFGDLPLTGATGAPDAIRRLTRALADRRFRHFVPDSGHIRALEELGTLPKGVRRYVCPAHSSFVGDGPVGPGRVGDAILFAGNLNAENLDRFTGAERALAGEINDEMVAAKKASWTASSWQAFRAAATAREARFSQAAPDNTFFWSLANALLDNLTASFRHEVLRQTPLPIDYHGGFANPEYAKTYDSSGHIRHRGSVPFDDLPALYSSYRLSVDVTNCPFINGSNAKVLDCFASGGFMLVDWRQDLAQELGDIANSFMYRSREELASLCDQAMSNPKRRAEVIGDMRARIGRSMTFGHLMRNAIEDALSPQP